MAGREDPVSNFVNYFKYILSDEMISTDDATAKFGGHRKEKKKNRDIEKTLVDIDEKGYKSVELAWESLSHKEIMEWFARTSKMRKEFIRGLAPDYESTYAEVETAPETQDILKMIEENEGYAARVAVSKDNMEALREQDPKAAYQVVRFLDERYEKLAERENAEKSVQDKHEKSDELKDEISKTDQALEQTGPTQEGPDQDKSDNERG